MAITNGQTADADDINAELSALASDISALDSAAVKLTGNQILQGVKTFGSIPVLPASNPTTDNQAVRKAYITTKDYIASENLRNSNDAENNTTATSYTKLKETLVPESMGAVRIKFEAARGFSYGANARIYINGIAVGTEQTVPGGGAYVAFSQDFAVAANDLIQVYAKCNAGDKVYVKNFRFYYDEIVKKIGDKILVTGLPTSSTTVVSMTNNL